jgi:hypothetical protein
MLSPKERVMRTIRFQEVDRVPYFYRGVASINKRIVSMPGCRDLRENIDFKSMDKDSVKVFKGFCDGVLGDDTTRCNNFFSTDVSFVTPRFIQSPGHSRREYHNGMIHAREIYDTVGNIIGTEKKLPLEDARTMDDIINFKGWSSPDWYEYQIPSQIVKHLKDKAVVAFGMGGLFHHSTGVRGMEKIMMDMAADKELAHAIFERISEWNLERTRRFLEANSGIIDIVGLGDDIAGQTGLLMSKDLWREMLKPHVQKMVDLSNKYGLLTYFHGDGGFSELIDDFIDMGINCTGRLQPEARGNDFKEIKKRFGKRICLWGAIDAQHKAILGDVKEVEDHVRNLLEINNGDPGFVIGPSHAFTADTPIENILAIYRILGDQEK